MTLYELVPMRTSLEIQLIISELDKCKNGVLATPQYWATPLPSTRSTHARVLACGAIYMSVYIAAGGWRFTLWKMWEDGMQAYESI